MFKNWLEKYGEDKGIYSWKAIFLITYIQKVKQRFM